MSGIVVVGAGQAGLQVGVSLREGGYSGPVTIVGDERDPPYQRPPLSKAFLLGKVGEETLHLRRKSVLDELALEFRAPDTVSRIFRQRKAVVLGSGGELPYTHLILATGTRNRKLQVPGSGLDGVVSLRSLDEAREIRRRLTEAKCAVVIGAGFIGLEFAAVAATQGVHVHVLEAASRVMARAVSPEMSAYFLRRHGERGTDITLKGGVTEIVGDGGRVIGVRTAADEFIAADLVLVGIGVKANDEIAAEAGLAVDAGIVVDDHLVTSDVDISAIGDCATHPNPFGEGKVRLESVQNAMDQARNVAARLSGRSGPYQSVPWFWSDQGSDKLQIAGLTQGSDIRVVKGDEATGRFSVFCFRRDRFAGLETVNRPSDHMLARKLLASGADLTVERASASDFDLKGFMAEPLAA